MESSPRVMMGPARQQMITTLAVAAFLESIFGEDPEARTRARHYLTTTLPHEVDEVRVAAAPGRMSP